MLLTGCAAQFGPQTDREPQPITDRDCGVFAEGGRGEASGGYGDFFRGEGSGRGGGALMRNAYVAAPDGTIQPCPLNVHVSPDGEHICAGKWCPDEPPAAPMSGTAEQWGTVMREAVEAAREPVAGERVP